MQDKEYKIKSNLQIFEGIQKMTNGIDTPLLDINRPEELKVKIRPDKTVGIGLFKVDPLLLSGYVAHPDTIRAMRKDIFVTDPDLLDRSLFINCESCKQSLDCQFWLYCPYCGENFK